MWSKQELSSFTGDPPGSPTYLAILGEVFDVSAATKFYSKVGAAARPPAAVSPRSAAAGGAQPPGCGTARGGVMRRGGGRAAPELRPHARPVPPLPHRCPSAVRSPCHTRTRAQGGGYAFFTGRDGSRAFVTGEFKDDLTGAAPPAPATARPGACWGACWGAPAGPPGCCGRLGFAGAGSWHPACGSGRRSGRCAGGSGGPQLRGPPRVPWRARRAEWAQAELWRPPWLCWHTQARAPPPAPVPCWPVQMTQRGSTRSSAWGWWSGAASTGEALPLPACWLACARAQPSCRPAGARRACLVAAAGP